MSFVSNILDSKGRDIWFVGPEATVFDAVKLMSEKRAGAVLVMKGETLVGIMTERDYARKIILEGKSSKQTQVKEVMTTPVLCVGTQTTTEQCMALMTDARTRHLPVVDDQRVIGVVSIGDLVKAIIDEQKILIDQLQHYIAG